MGIWIDTELCNGCKRCLQACPYDAIVMRGEKAFVLERCTACGACIEVCRQAAVKSDLAPREIPDFSDYQGVWALAEIRQGELHPVSLELLGEARKLAQELEQEVGVILVGAALDHLTETLSLYGAARICLVDDADLEAFHAEVHADVVARVVREFRPAILLLGATMWGRELAPRLARRLGTGLTADCTALAVDEDEKILLQTRPAFGGNVMATIATRYSRPQMATVRPGVMAPCACPGNCAEIVRFDAAVATSVSPVILKVVREARQRVRLSEARVIVAGGRGSGGEKGFELIEKLAQSFGGEVAGTRIAVEEGWLPVERQVGQTGQTVRPELYIACGISGAIQHRAGMHDSRYIIAINQDSRAPIFSVADWGIVGDLHKVIPEILAQIEGDKA